ncbi:MAG TPA: DnaJ C-terminal domain-containing protein [Pseudorhizobium sp.]|nr:DnaJ C-terminal domain-containing protein [Pseudorhizobium sp.]
MRDPYSILGVQRNADTDEIKSAWRSKAKSSHPDHNQGDPMASTRFAEIGRAYEVLKDPERRKRYDRALEAQQTIMQQRQSAREAAERAKVARAKAEMVMEELARANAKRAQAQAATAGEAAEDMVERIFGAAAGDTSADPKRAAGTGSFSPGATASPEAAGTGDDAVASPGAAEEPQKAQPAAEVQPLAVQAVEVIASLMRRIRGIAPPPEKAPDHAVEAKATLEDLLKLASVTIKLPEDREVRLPLEKGMTDGYVARLKGQGLKVQGMLRGDLLVTVRVEKDSRFRVDGFDLHTVLPVALEDAVLGAEKEIETPEGVRTVAIPAWSGSDRAIVLEGLGLHDDDGGRGKLVVELRVLLHEKPDDKITDLMRHMREGLYV